MNPETEKRAIAFIRTVGNRCTACLRRSKENCANCISSWANSILRDIENEKPPEIDYSLAARVMMITGALQKSNRPLASHEIHLADYCTKQLKYWTLRRMMRWGMIDRDRSRPDGAWLYRLLPKNNKNPKEHKQ